MTRDGLLDVLRSSVRPLLTYGFAVVFLTGFVLGLVDREVFQTAAVSIFSFWFGSRQAQK